MAIVLGEVITEARKMLQDSDSTLQRFSDADMLGFANQTLKRIAILRPDLFAYIGDITCTDGEVLQTAPSDSIRLFEIFRVKTGGSLREVNRETLDQTYSTWQSETAAAATMWMRHPRNPNRFFIYPPAPVSQVLTGEYAQTPPDYDDSTDVTLLPEGFFPTVVDGVVWLAESVDNEHVTSQRAAMFQESFIQSLQANMESRKVTDSEKGGNNKEDYR